MTPTFKMHGSKARVAAWVVGHFPKFRRLLEPFAGRGNIFFRACTDCEFQEVLLNDLNSHPFLEALRDYSGDWSFVDDGQIDKEVWQRWVDAPSSQERTLAESYVARFGSSYATGPAKAGGDSQNGHSKRNTILRMKEAQKLLREKRAQISCQDWEEFLLGIPLQADDLVYLDPPYDVPQVVHYKNIDQDRFLEIARSLPCSVFVSGYTSPRYESALSGPGWFRDTIRRASVGKGVASKGQTGTKPVVEEILWWRTHPDAELPIGVLEMFAGDL